MVDLEDAQLGIWVTMRKGVQTSAKQDILRNASGNSVRKIVFSVAITGDQKRAKSDGEWPVGTCRRTAKLLRIRVAEDGNGDGVVEDQGSCVVKLMRGSAESNAEGSSRWTGGLHLCQCSHIALRRSQRNREGGLASDEASFTIGSDLLIDGGMIL